MVNLTIDKLPAAVPDGTTILQAARGVGIEIPTLCYLEGINEIGACRVCVVEVEGLDRLVAACSTPAENGMNVLTNSPRVRSCRKVNVDLLLSRHDCQCVVCVRSGNCGLQDLANDLGLHERVYKNETIRNEWDKTFPLHRNMSKCIQCMRCIQVCDNIQGLYVWDLVNFGSHIDVDVSRNMRIQESQCSLCGQCITHCPVGALTARDDTDRVYAALADPGITTVVQVAPAVRSAWAESLGLDMDKVSPGKMVSALRRIGFDYVFDTDFAADLTIMEEGTEFIERVIKTNETAGFPMFTSCCPGWVRFLKSQYPDMVDCLSSAKSPQQMFGAVAKTWFAASQKIDPAKMFVVSVMPCVAKKHECALPGMDSAGAGPDVDAVLTTREFTRMLRSDHVNVKELPDEPFDMPLGEASGAGVIFGATGGVMEAALRTVYCVITGKKPPTTDAFRKVRGMEGWKSAEFDIEGRTVRVAVASGLGNARALVEAIRKREVQYDFVEIMACPGGCAGGGGQPIAMGREPAGERGERLFNLDEHAPVRYSHENAAVNRLYGEYLEKPLSHGAHELLHSDHHKWTMPHR